MSTTKEQRRAAMPLTTAFIDSFRDAFGDPAGILAIENGHTVRWPKRFVPIDKGVSIETKEFCK